MKEMISRLQKPEEAWHRFLEFDQHITQTILKECQENKISVCLRHETESVVDVAEIVVKLLGIWEDRQ